VAFQYIQEEEFKRSASEE